MACHARQPGWSRCLPTAALLGLAACGGGGGGDDDGAIGDDPAPPMPSVLTFSGALTEGVPMVVSADGLSLPVIDLRFRGTWDRTAHRYGRAASETSQNLDLGLAGVLATGVTATASWVGFAPPAQAGTLSAQAFPVPSGVPLFTGIASMTVLSEAAVRLSWTGTVPPTTVDYSWDTFLDADMPADWQAGLQAGVAMLALDIDKVQLALEQFVFVTARDAQLVAAGAAGVATTCAGGSGSRLVVWNDANRDGALGPGDAFTVTFSSCLVERPGDVDQRLDGRLVISNYIENASPFSVGGRVDLVGLRQTETDARALALSTSGSLQLFISGP